MTEDQILNEAAASEHKAQRNYVASLFISGRQPTTYRFAPLDDGEGQRIRVQISQGSDETYEVLDTELKDKDRHFLTMMIVRGSSDDVPNLGDPTYSGPNGYFTKIYKDLSLRYSDFDESNIDDYYDDIVDTLVFKISQFAEQAEIDLPADLLAQFIAENSRNPAVRQALQKHAQNNTHQKKATRKVYPERTMNKQLARFHAARDEFTKHPAGSNEKRLAAMTLVATFEALQQRGYDVEQLEGRDVVREARTLKRGQFSRKKASGLPAKAPVP